MTTVVFSPNIIQNGQLFVFVNQEIKTTFVCDVSAMPTHMWSHFVKIPTLSLCYNGSVLDVTNFLQTQASPQVYMLKVRV